MFDDELTVSAILFRFSFDFNASAFFLISFLITDSEAEWVHGQFLVLENMDLTDDSEILHWNQSGKIG